MTPQRFEHLRLERVSRRFGGRLAVDGLDLTVSGGEFVALLGPSGCGKSTALNCIAGLLPLTDGSIWLDDRRIDTVPPERRGFGMVFQNYALFPHLTVRGNVGFGLRMRGVGRQEARRRVDEALNLVQLADYAGRLPGQLSGGQQQRVAIARAIVIEPPLVLMDEPLSNLDAALRLEMRTEIRRLHQSLGLTTVYVTHDQEEALSLADRLVVLRDGVVQQIGTPEDLYRAPANPYVAGFMGYRNLLPMHVDVVTGDGSVTCGDRGLTLVGTARQRVTAGPAVLAIRPEDFVVGGVEPADGADSAGVAGAVGVTGTAGAGGGRQHGRGAASGGENAMRVLVEVTEYHGREHAVQGRLPGGQVIRMRTGERLRPGDTVTVHVPRDRVLVYAAGQVTGTGHGATAGTGGVAPGVSGGSGSGGSGSGGSGAGGSGGDSGAGSSGTGADAASPAGRAPGDRETVR